MKARKATTGSVSSVSLLVIGCFFFSGMSGLIYEILWTRLTVSVIGGAPFAVATILTVFMGGLGLGSYLASRKIDNIKEPLKLVRLYGVLELIIGAYGLLLPLLLNLFKPVFGSIYNQMFEQFMLYNLLTFALCCVLLIIPVTLMGATLPILCRFYVRRLGHLGTKAGLLYGLNTIGAAAGSLVCGFWLIKEFGMWGALGVAVMINALIGLVCLVVSRRSRLQESRYETIDSEKQDTGRFGVPQYRGAIAAALIIFAVSGFCAMAYEVIWTKLLGLIVGPTTYSFTIVLVTFILGLALGSIIFGWLADRTRDAVRLLLVTQVAAALFALGISQLLGGSQMFFAKIIFVYQDDFTMRSLMKGVSLFALMVLPTLCLGATFPLVGKIYTQSIAAVGRSIGRAYAVNTVGAVLGSFAAGFILIPLFGKETGLSMVVGIQLGTAILVAILVILANRAKPPSWAPLILIALVGVALCIKYPSFDRRQLSLGKAHRVNEIATSLRGRGWLETLWNGPKILSSAERGELLYYADGIGGFTTVLKNQYQLGDIYYAMANSGKVDASTHGDMRTQTLLAHFPMLFHPNPKSVMVLGLASGITAGGVLCYPVEQLDAVEINRQVIAASEFFNPWNNNVLTDPRTNLIIQDGRAHLSLSDKKYDVIISEPSNPWLAGLAALFTRDFFALAHEHLSQNGIFVQFIHSYQMDWSNFALVGRTFADVFPNSIMVSTAPSGMGPDYLLVGFKGERQLELSVAQRNLEYAQRSKNIVLSDPRLIYRMILSEDLRPLFGEGPLNTDDTPLLEFAAPKLLYEVDTTIEQNILSRRRLSAETQDIISQVKASVDLQIDYVAYALSVHTPFAAMVDLANATEAQRQRFFELTDNYIATHSVNFDLFTDTTLKRYWRELQIASIEANIANLPNKALSYSYMGDFYRDLNRLDEAVAAYQKSLEYDNRVASVRCNLGAVLTQQGLQGVAIAQFDAALKIDPRLANAYVGKGIALALQNKPEEALEHLRRAVEINPDDARAQYNLGLTLARLNRPSEAVGSFSEALRINPHFADAHCNLGAVLLEIREFDKAIEHYKEALRLRPEFPTAQQGLERALFAKQVHDR